MKKLNQYIVFLLLCSFFIVACERDNYDEPDATIQGAIFDSETTEPLQVDHGSGIIRMREISWGAGDTTMFIGNQTLKVQQDGTYRNTKWFSGDYRMLPYSGAFYPYDDENLDNDEAGELVHISGTTTKNFTVTPYLSIEWVVEPFLTSDGYIECSVRFSRNQKTGYEMPDVKEAWLLISRTVNTSARDLNLYPRKLDLTNVMEDAEIVFKSDRQVKYVGVDYWVRVSMNCQTAAGKPETNYPGMGSNNFTTIKKVEVGDDVVIEKAPEQIISTTLNCIKLASDASLDGGNGANSMFDGSLTEKYESGKSDIWPQSFTVDLGSSYNLTTFKMYPFDREDFYFKRHTVATFELYGWKGDGEPEDDWNNPNWVKIDNYVNIKPSGMPTNSTEYNVLTDEDKAAGKDGTEFEVPEGQEAYRYVRFLITNNFNRTTEYGGTGSDGNRFNISELKFWYMPEE